MNRAFPPEDETPLPSSRGAAAEPTPAHEDAGPMDNLFREIRRLLALRSFDEVINKLDVHRPAEWAAVDLKGMRILRFLGQAYLGKGDLSAGRDCLEQLRALQREKARLSRDDYSATLSDLVKCYRALKLDALAKECQEEARRLMLGN